MKLFIVYWIYNMGRRSVAITPREKIWNSIVLEPINPFIYIEKEPIHFINLVNFVVSSLVKMQFPE